MSLSSVAPDRLPRSLGLWTSVSLVIGITIGSGIFRSPAEIAQRVPSPLLMLGLWAAGGLITLCGALSLAELAAALPQTGGSYAYLREAWGRLPAFLFGWSELVLIQASGLGGIAVAFSDYLLQTFGVDPVAHPLVERSLSAGAIAFAAGANMHGVNLGAAIVGVSTAAKFSALVVLVGSSLVLGGAHGASFSHLTTSSGAPLAVGGLGLALVSVLWAYDGFGDLSFAGGEVKDPQTNLPRAIIIGTLVVIGTYLLTNVAYLYVIPIDVISRSPIVAADVMIALFGRVFLRDDFDVQLLQRQHAHLPAHLLRDGRRRTVFQVDCVGSSALPDALCGDSHGRAPRHRPRSEPQLRRARQYVRARQLAVLCAERRRDLSVAPPPPGDAPALQSSRLSRRARRVHRPCRRVGRQRAHQRTDLDRHHVDGHPLGNSGLLRFF
jgi:hypothetical protein